MKRKIFVSLVVAGWLLIPAVMRSQDEPNSSGIEQGRTQAARREAIVRQGAEAPDAEAQRQFQAEIQRNRNLAANERGRADDEYKRANAMFVDRLRGVVQRGPGSPGRSLVIRSSEMDPKEQASLEEDLMIMSHVLEKALSSAIGSQKQPSSYLGVDVAFGPGSSSIRGFYLEGYGAVFTVKVGIPLVAPVKNEMEKQKPASESAWDEARQEVYGGRMEPKSVYVRIENYDEKKVNDLRNTLLETLKNASNIRGLKADDLVTVCVLGGPGAGGWDSAAGREELEKLQRQLNDLRTRYTDTWPTVLNTRERIKALEAQLATNEGSQPVSTTLTIRVKKSDVDSFAKDKLNLDDFRKKAKIMPYAGAVDSPRAATFGGGSTGGGGGFGANPGF
jgi:hypothetical protein